MAPRIHLGSCLVSALLLVVALPVGLAGTPSTTLRSEVFEEVWTTVRDQFFDPHLNGVDWVSAKQRYSAKVDHAQTAEEFAAVVNQMLSELRTSHTHYYTPQDPAYFHRSEEHTSELQSLRHLVCRLLLQKMPPGRYRPEHRLRQDLRQLERPQKCFP